MLVMAATAAELVMNVVAVGVVMSVVVGSVGTTAAAATTLAAAAVVVLQLHLCQRILMSQAGGACRCVVVSEALMIVGVLFEGSRRSVRVLQGTQAVVAGVLAHVVHLDVGLGFGRQQPGDGERMTRGRIAGRFLLEVHRVVIAEQRWMAPVHHGGQFLLLELLVVRSVVRLGLLC